MAPVCSFYHTNPHGEPHPPNFAGISDPRNDSNARFDSASEAAANGSFEAFAFLPEYGRFSASLSDLISVWGECPGRAEAQGQVGLSCCLGWKTRLG